MLGACVCVRACVRVCVRECAYVCPSLSYSQRLPPTCRLRQLFQSCLRQLAPAPAVEAMVDREDLEAVRGAASAFLQVSALLREGVRGQEGVPGQVPRS